MATRIAAAVAATALALALPVLFVLFAVVNDRWRPLVSALLTIAVVVPLVLFLLRLSADRRRAAAAAEEAGDVTSP
jgi:hypothetical protein